jgi:sugar phosphate isomerase/epimerase
MPVKFRFACHLITWVGEQRENPEKVLHEVASAGYEGVEGLPIQSPEQLVEMATLAARYNLHIVNAGGPSPEASINHNITLGNKAAEVPSCRRDNFGGPDPRDEGFRKAGESLKDIIAYAQEHHIKPFHHAHLRTMIETVEDAEKLLNAAPGLYLLFDTGHMLAAGSDPLRVFENLRDRIGHVHLKDFTAEDPKTWNHRTSKWMEDGRFEELGKGNMGFDVKAVLDELRNVGYDGWVSVEQDRATHHSPAETAKVNMEYLKSLL